MNRLPFVKMQAQGNDFVILDGRISPLPDLSKELIQSLASRRTGIGCDQVLVLLDDAQADACLRIFNNDGTEAENCGNGLRCVGYLMYEDNSATSFKIRLNGRCVSIETGDKSIRLHMGSATITERKDAHVDVDIGNPHRVFFEAIETFPEDRNIEIVSGQIGDNVYVDIIERGVGHTPACGSGACAVAVAVWDTDGHSRPQTIHMPGGEVTVSGNRDDIILEGPVCQVFSGEYRLSDGDGLAA